MAGASVHAVTFAGNRQHERYAGDLPVERVVERLATAEGRLGSCREYLLNTVSCLEELGFRDSNMHILLRRMYDYDAANGQGGMEADTED